MYKSTNIVYKFFLQWKISLYIYKMLHHILMIEFLSQWKQTYLLGNYLCKLLRMETASGTTTMIQLVFWVP